MSNNPATKYFATGVAAVVLTFGAYLIGKSNTDPAAAGTNASQAVQGAAPQGGQAPGATGQAPRSGQAPPGFGTAVTGDVAKKVAAAATAKYPGTVERVMKLQDGSYVAHVITTSGERHVLVSKALKVTGSEQGGPGGGGGAPPSGTQPQSAPSASGSQS